MDTRWPLCSPDLNFCDFFIWRTLKQKLYSVDIDNEGQMWNCSQFADEGRARRVYFNFCITENGGYKE